MASYETEAVTINKSLVYRDKINTWRWYDAFGPGIVKYIANMAATPTDDTTGMPTEFTYTLVGASTFATTDVAGGAWLLTTAGLENDGVKLQLGDEKAGAGENVSFAANYPTYLGAKLQISDATQSDFLVGFCVTDTTCLDGVTDGLYFRKVDGYTAVSLVLENTNVESVTAVGTAANATDIHLEMLVQGGYVYAYVNDTLMATVATSNASMPNDELLRLTLEFLTGADAAITMTVKELRFIQLQN